METPDDEQTLRDLIRDPEDGDEEDEFRQYVEEGRPMSRDLTREEALWVYLNLK